MAISGLTEDKRYAPSDELSFTPSAMTIPDKQQLQSSTASASSKSTLPQRQFKIPPETQSGLNRLPNAVLTDVLMPLFSMDAKAKSRASCQVFYKQSQLEMAVGKLLTHVARGEQDQAEAMLKENPNLLLHQGNVTDYSGRKFYNITAFQYALWAYDRHMWNMLLKYFPGNKIEEKDHALEQLQKLENRYGYWGRHYDWGIARKISNESQKLVPAHVANEYCRLDRCMLGTFINRRGVLIKNVGEPSFHEEVHLPRSFKVGSGHWYPLDAHSVLCKETVIGRGAFPQADVASEDCLSKDAHAMNRLRQVRQSEYLELWHNLSVKKIKEKFYTQLREILENKTYWSNNTHYQFCWGGTKYKEYRIPKHIAQMLEPKNVTFDQMTDIAVQAIEPTLFMRFFCCQTEKRSAGRDPKTKAFYTLLTYVKRIANNENYNEIEKQKKIQTAIDAWKENCNYIPVCSTASALRPTQK
jgi:hypothetical protein